MGKWVAENVILEMVKRNLNFKESKILILGFTFKEDCSDIRNTRVIDIIKHLKEYQLELEVVDPQVNKEEVLEIYELESNNKIPKREYSVIICAVAHKQFSEIKEDEWKSMIRKNGFIYDLKGIIPKGVNPIRL